MLSARSVFQEIVDNDDAFRLFCSIAAAGEAQGGWENGVIAARLPEQLAYLAPKVLRHGADEDKHGRLFLALLRRRDLTACDVPAATNYTMLLEERGMGVSHRVLAGDAPLEQQDVIDYLVHSRVTEQRASEQMNLLVRHFADHPTVGRTVRMIAADEQRHLAYCQQELLRLRADGAGSLRRALRACAREEVEVHRGVSLAVTAQLGALLGWSRAKRALLGLAIRVVAVYERLWGWRRFVTLREPAPSTGVDNVRTAPAPGR
jgi:hypothetical protein